jgi:hypothetical protein
MKAEEADSINNRRMAKCGDYRESVEMGLPVCRVIILWEIAIKGCGFFFVSSYYDKLYQ